MQPYSERFLLVSAIDGHLAELESLATVARDWLRDDELPKFIENSSVSAATDSAIREMVKTLRNIIEGLK